MRFSVNVRSGQGHEKQIPKRKTLSWLMIELNKKKRGRGTTYSVKDVFGALLVSQQAFGREIKCAPER